LRGKATQADLELVRDAVDRGNFSPLLHDPQILARLLADAVALRNDSRVVTIAPEPWPMVFKVLDEAKRRLVAYEVKQGRQLVIRLFVDQDRIRR
jgi:hypothetical protein